MASFNESYLVEKLSNGSVQLYHWTHEEEWHKHLAPMTADQVAEAINFKRAYESPNEAKLRVELKRAYRKLREIINIINKHETMRPTGYMIKAYVLIRGVVRKKGADEVEVTK